MKKIIGIFMCTLLVTIVFPLSAIAGDETNPEIVDETGDNPLSLLDIDSAWFYEIEEEPDFLYIAMKLLFLKENFNAVFSVRWSYNNENYVAGVNTFYFRTTIFRCGLVKRATYWQWNRMPRCNGIFDIEDTVITWKIPKSNIGNPQAGEVLTKTKAYAVPGFPTSFLYYIFQYDFRDWAPNIEYGMNYIIKY